nr:hypothetical protein BCU61_06160 [Vibrio splendidus]
MRRVFFEELWSLYQLLFLFIPGRLGHHIRGFCLSVFFKKKSGRITIKENVEIYHPERIIMGFNSGFGRNNIIDAYGGIEIGNNVRIGPNVMIATMTHASIGQKIGHAKKQTKKVIIRDDVWVGHGVTILPGVIVNEGVIVAAGAVVTKSIPSGETVAGVPAKIVKRK